jgi:hypothetical protein
MEPIGCPETSVRNYHYSLRNDPGERCFHLLCGGSLKSPTIIPTAILKFFFKFGQSEQTRRTVLLQRKFKKAQKRVSCTACYLVTGDKLFNLSLHRVLKVRPNWLCHVEATTWEIAAPWWGQNAPYVEAGNRTTKKLFQIPFCEIRTSKIK